MKKNGSFYNAVRDRIYEAGLITPNNENDKQLILKAIEEWLDQSLNNDTKIIVDHTESILEEARKFKRAEEFQYSKIFYALYFEHIINDIIFYYCITRKIGEKGEKGNNQVNKHYGEIFMAVTDFRIPKI